jgi:hypothetical protein
MLSAGPKLSTGDGYVKGQADSSTDIALQVRVMSAQMRARPGAARMQERADRVARRVHVST